MLRTNLKKPKLSLEMLAKLQSHLCHRLDINETNLRIIEAA